MTPQFLADEDLRHQIVLSLRRREPGLGIVTVREAGLAGIDDREVLEFASNEALIVVSHDVNTMRAEAERRLQLRLPMPGLLLAPQARPSREVVEDLLLVWTASEASEWENLIVYLPL